MASSLTARPSQQRAMSASRVTTSPERSARATSTRITFGSRNSTWSPCTTSRNAGRSRMAPRTISAVSLVGAVMPHPTTRTTSGRNHKDTSVPTLDSMAAHHVKGTALGLHDRRSSWGSLIARLRQARGPVSLRLRGFRNKDRNRMFRRLFPDLWRSVRPWPHAQARWLQAVRTAPFQERVCCATSAAFLTADALKAVLESAPAPSSAPRH